VPDLGGDSVAYINIHLDYGLKQTGGYLKDSNSNALDNTLTTHLIDNLLHYDFSVSTGVPGDTIINQNNFKKNPGFGTIVTTSDGTPIQNVQVKIVGPDKKVLTTMLTDEDGWNAYVYKWTGKSASFTMSLPQYPSVPPQTFTLKANGCVVVNFKLP